MLSLPTRFAGIILAFAPLFVHHSWQHAQNLLVGAILTPGQRTVTSILRIRGRAQERRFVNVHCILNRAAWCPRSGSRILLGLLVDAFAQRGPVVLGLDDTIERRHGKRIAAKGIYRDPVRSSDSHFVKASGLRWMSLMVLAPIPWAGRVWALPFLTALVPSERACRERGRRHKPLLDVGRQLALQARRWLPRRDLVVVGDSGFSALLFLDAMRRARITAITRLRLDAALYEPAPPRPPGTIGRPRTKGARLPTLAAILAAKDTRWHAVVVPGWYGAGERTIEIATDTAVWRHGGLPVVPIRWILIRDPEARFPPQAPLCTDPTREPTQIVGWFVRRWTIEVTFQEARAHLGMETRAAVVGQGHRPHHALPARPVLDRHTAGRTPLGSPTATRRGGRVVPQTAPDLRRCTGRRALCDPARTDFGNITAPTRPNKTPLPFASAFGLCALPRRVNGQSRAKSA
ncbi:transposase [Methylobacterium sp. 092160098-2]|uniref:IS701 family transposase n=1 Tax=Methylobacterium sp. 092160098-2 TaxID=3025129 RepID=UPI0023819C59|nr:transposase [Methylobacterium sp. 092160098-2]MDE4915212.1 transposase [Methylobacterium sp. 092160098-2]